MGAVVSAVDVTVSAVGNPNAATAELDMFRTFPALSTSSTVGVQVPPWLNCGMFTLTVPDTLNCPPKVTVFPYHTVWEGLYHVTATASTPDRSSVTLKVDRKSTRLNSSHLGISYA